ncbi:hypothetical protein [Companilactobacillus farciminis]|uniref:hypothetical protein n=1 Tax=Companilactobacillus farciminis TaxID=1612 RepID=UPI00241D959E|nr:hypothetical protein [Companilactobacillus farciminis]
MLKDIILLTKDSGKNKDPLNHVAKYSEQVLHSARVTEFNGATAQNNAVGKQYNHSYVIRLEGIYSADKVAFLDDYRANKSNVLQISQLRKHHFKTDIYCGDTEVRS